MFEMMKINTMDNVSHDYIFHTIEVLACTPAEVVPVPSACRRGLRSMTGAGSSRKARGKRQRGQRTFEAPKAVELKAMARSVLIILTEREFLNHTRDYLNIDTLQQVLFNDDN